MVKVVAARVRLPVFSISNPESFQILSALPVPQPSSLVGSLAYAIGVAENKGLRVLEEVYGLVEKSELLAARARPLGEEAAAPPLIPSALVVRRFRVADKAHESKEKGERKPVELLGSALSSGSFEDVKKLLEVELMDAFYREYVMGIELLCLWVFKSWAPPEHVVRLIHRLGDTESLCTVTDVTINESQLLKKRLVETSFPAPWLEGARVVKGSYYPAKLCNEVRKLSLYIMPLRIEVERRSGLRYPTIRPASVTIDYGSEVTVCETKWGDLVVGR